MSLPAADLISSSLRDDGLAVFNPATGEQIAAVADDGPDVANAAIADADAAFKNWAGRTARERASVLRAWASLLMSHAEELAALATAECGKPLPEAKGEVFYAASFLEWFAEEGKRAYGDIVPSHQPNARILVLKQPVGVSAAITPWNFPLAMITRKAGPALAAGCPMVLKPAEATPLSALALEALAHQAGVPEAVFRVVTTADPKAVGEAFCDSGAVRKLSFTGSTRVGKLLAAQCASTVKRLSLELGGNAPFIVFDDADIDAAVAGAMGSKYRNAGQTCVCANRILVQAGVYDAFVEQLAERVSGLTVGNGADDGVQIGPLINQAGIGKVADLVDDALKSGASVVVGGGRHEAGELFFQPTVLTGVSAEMRVAREEIFGPVAPIIRFETVDEALQLANDTPYGLAAYFYARDMARIFKVLEGLDYGMVAANEGVLSAESAPFGGVKESGLGREGSKYGLDEYIELKYGLLGGLS
ncbi:MAG: NAD-dependent succinate-semialdehyde dehydrogenase [Pseudomonadota bacterium]